MLGAAVCGLALLAWSELAFAVLPGLPAPLQPAELPPTQARPSFFTAWMLKQLDLEAHSSSRQDISVQIALASAVSITAPLFGAASALWPAQVSGLSGSAAGKEVILDFTAFTGPKPAFILPEGITTLQSPTGVLCWDHGTMMNFLKVAACCCCRQGVRVEQSTHPLCKGADCNSF